MFDDLYWIENRRQVVRTIASAGADNCSNVFADKHVFEFARPPLDRTGKVEITIENRLEVERFVAGATQTLTTRLQHLAFHIGRRRNDSHLVAGMQSPRLDWQIVGSGNHLV